MESRDTAGAEDGPIDSRPQDGPSSDAADRDAATGPTIVPGFNRFEALISPRWGHTATLLPNGQVLIAAGQDQSYNPLADISSQFSPNTLATAEVHDTDAGTVAATGSLTGRATGTRPRCSRTARC